MVNKCAKEYMTSGQQTRDEGFLAGLREAGSEAEASVFRIERKRPRVDLRVAMRHPYKCAPCRRARLPSMEDVTYS